ncbi:hypothetical protein G7K_4469-t1 [Saitoella complicata NRRL Y-17804]|uniref:JmjC domain-containing protein n=1 Tax=Saitoella complicata (strain BCRC 22490 / CBS 7301 / JCM 7358 / NBRC 10748 / NRRL Y-17804) TaxID=698492 RepID=A0A0E9NKW2_SAICN|nr:hypothetical protein G7K_4469-t1 [Saitoella complicata NRRL Y-17804]
MEQIVQDMIREYQERVHHPSATEFAKIVSRNRPVVITGVLEEWPARRNWSLSNLRQKVGHTMVDVAETPSGNADSVVGDHFVQPYVSVQPLNSVFDWLESRHKGSREGNVKYVQTQNGNLATEFSTLQHDVLEFDWAKEVFGSAADAANIWIGNSESVTSLHKDPYENLYCQIAGVKTFTLIPPWEFYCLDERLLPTATYQPVANDKLAVVPDSPPLSIPWLCVDPTAPEQSPTFSEFCRPLRVDLQPGEVLYLPALWFHHVGQRSDEEGKVIAVNWWYDMCYSQPLYAQFNFMKAIVLAAKGGYGWK